MGANQGARTAGDSKNFVGSLLKRSPVSSQSIAANCADWISDTIRGRTDSNVL